MTSVQNHQLQLSGNKTVVSKKNIFFALLLALGASSCAPKVGVLRSPNHPVSTTSTDGGKESTNHGHVDNTVKKNKFELRNIALLLPFQLNQITTSSIDEKDVKRSALALDFYQGFELGLEELTKKGAGFNLDVLDTRDNARFVAGLATSDNLNHASLVVGPVFPQEIKSFGAAFPDKDVLQINPLAAAMPTEFNLPNLVSITPSIKAHASATAARVAKDFSANDVIIVYNTTDADSRQFLTGMAAAIKQAKSTANIVSVSSLAQLNESMKTFGTTFIVAGTTDKVQLKALIDNLTSQYLENYYSINLFGHPLWDRFDFSMYPEFSSLRPMITTESNLRPWSTAVKNFKEDYYSSFGVNPSDASYKGYDAAVYFGGLIAKFGAGNIKDRLTKDHYSGIFSAYRFKHNEVWGYVNEAVFFKAYQGGSFQLQ